jgi:hypothetical protein
MPYIVPGHDALQEANKSFAVIDIEEFERGARLLCFDILQKQLEEIDYEITEEDQACKSK